MAGRTTGIVWIAIGVASGVVAELGQGPAAWLPATGVLVASSGGGVPVILGVGTSILAGWSGARGQPACPVGPGDTASPLRGFATEPSAGPRGAVAFRFIPAGAERRRVRIGPTACTSEIPVYGHRGGLEPGVSVEVFGVMQKDGRGRPTFVADSIKESPQARRPVEFGAFLVRVRASLDARIERTLGPSAPLALALVSGRRSDVPRHVRDEFSRSGTAHLLAISGFHVGVVGGLFALGAALFGAGPRSRTGVAALLVWVYVLVIGSPASGVRAAGLLSVVGVGRLLGRPTRRLPGLAAVFLACLISSPDLIGGIGFQLSFAASLGLLLTAGWPDRAWEVISRRLPSSPWPASGMAETLVRGATVAVGATLPTIPLVAWHFGTVSLVSVPATLIAMPLAAASIVAVIGAVVAESVWPEAGVVLGAGAGLVLGAFEFVVRLWANLPFAAVPVAGTTAIKFATIAGIFLLLSPRGGGVRSVVLALALSVTGGTLLVDSWGRSAARGTVEIIFIDVGQGDAVLVRSPANRWTLIDAGPASATWDAGARRVVPLLARLGVDEIETLVLTHADADHVGGAAAVLERLSVRNVVGPGRARGTLPFVSALEQAGRRDVPWRSVRAGERWELDGVHFEVLSPDGIEAARSANEESVVVLVRFGQFEALLTGDASTQVERAVLDRLPESLEVLKVGHHGSETSTAAELLDRTSPQLAVISVGARNRYGHPARSVVSRLTLHRARILRTDLQGTIRIVGTERGQFSVTTAR